MRHGFAQAASFQRWGGVFAYFIPFSWMVDSLRPGEGLGLSRCWCCHGGGSRSLGCSAVV